MYEKTIANQHRFFNIIIPSSPTLVLNLLTPTDLATYNSIVNIGLQVDPIWGGHPPDKNLPRIPVDGYILSYDNFWYVGSDANGTAFETIPVDERCTFPISFWLNKVYIYAPTNINGIIRIFFS